MNVKKLELDVLKLLNSGIAHSGSYIRGHLGIPFVAGSEMLDSLLHKGDISKSGQAIAEYTITAKGRQRYFNTTPAFTLATDDRISAVDDPVLTELLCTSMNSQDALDAYVVSVADAEILQPLRTARDAAKEALKHYCQSIGVDARGSL